MATINPILIAGFDQVVPVMNPAYRALASGVYMALTPLIAQNDTVTAVFEVPKQTLVDEVKMQIATAFDGTAPALTVGDGDDADGYFSAADIGVLVATAGFKSSKKSGQPYAGGKLYSVGDTIDVAVTAGSGTAGRFRLALTFRLNADRNLFAA